MGDPFSIDVGFDVVGHQNLKDSSRGYPAKVGDEWHGALTASLGPVSVRGFGILPTDEFSILVLLAAEFKPPI
jgi:hypothetical protein